MNLAIEMSIRDQEDEKKKNENEKVLSFPNVEEKKYSKTGFMPKSLKKASNPENEHSHDHSHSKRVNNRRNRHRGGRGRGKCPKGVSGRPRPKRTFHYDDY